MSEVGATLVVAQTGGDPHTKRATTRVAPTKKITHIASLPGAIILIAIQRIRTNLYSMFKFFFSWAGLD